MASASLYTHYACPCTDISAGVPNPTHLNASDEEDDEEEQTLNPHSPRANYNLYPLENLLFCNDCNEIRCPKCYYEEVLLYYCPSCLFEVQSALVKSESNRCNRSCYQCPLCIAPLQINVYQASENSRGRSSTMQYGDGVSYILSCPHCCWSSLEAGLRFPKATDITGQLAELKVREAEESAQLRLEPRNTQQESGDEFSRALQPASQDHFVRLATFYRGQISDTDSNGAAGGLGSPSYGIDNLRRSSRLRRLRRASGVGLKGSKVPVMREAMNFEEGLQMSSVEDDEDSIIDRMRSLGWAGTTTLPQREAQPTMSTERFSCDLRPTATPLRTKRTKRCRTCRHMMVCPEDKRGSAKFKIRLVALDYIPRITLKPLDPTPNSSQLTPLKSTYFILTLRNPLFEAVKINLATPRTTPGLVESKITLLCPQFDVGANAETWNDALDLTGSAAKGTSAQQGQQAEAGKVWAKGKNWTSVVMEVVPGLLEQTDLSGKTQTKIDGDDANLEIPIFVRMEYETDDASQVAEDEKSTTGRKGGISKVRRELAFWCVVGVGRVGAL